MKRLFVSAVLLAITVQAPASYGGTYSGSNIFVSGIFPFPAFMIVHAPGYSGTGGALTVNVCVSPGGEQVVPLVDAAIARWTARPVSTSNCADCLAIEEPPVPDGATSLSSTLIHELGHCVFGLGHPNLGGGDGSFTMTRRHTSLETCDIGACPGCDFSQPQTCTSASIPGDEDDRILPQPPSMDPADILHWFEDDVNNPFEISAETVTLTRRRIDLPSGHNWPVNGSRLAGLLRGFPETQVVMYSSIEVGAVYSSFTADDIATVSNAEVGLDRQAGTADDYAVELVRVDDCSLADVEVQWVPASSDPDLMRGSLAVCNSFLEEVPGQTPLPGGLGVQHYRLIPELTNVRIEVKVNSEQSWLEFEPVFVDGFESGDTTAWDQTIP